MRYTLLLFFLSFSFLSGAQDCSKEALRNKPGTWKAGAQGSIANVHPSDLAKEKAVIAAIHNMVSRNYKPGGCQVSYSTVFGKYPGEGQTFIADPYHYSMYILRYLCDASSKDKTKYYVDHSTPTTVNIAANVYYPLNNLYAAFPVDDSRGYLKLKERPVKKDGYYFMGEEVVGDYGTSSEIREVRWLITYSDTLPFSYLSRKEYLQIQKKRLQKAIKDGPGEQAYYKKFLKNIEDYLSRPENELNMPAICMWNEEERFEKFVDEGTKGSFIAIKTNNDYYRQKLPKSAPQFFSVVFKVSIGDPVFIENIEAIKKAVDFAALRSMLGK